MQSTLSAIGDVSAPCPADCMGFCRKAYEHKLVVSCYDIRKGNKRALCVTSCQVLDAVLNEKYDLIIKNPNKSTRKDRGSLMRKQLR